MNQKQISSHLKKLETELLSQKIRNNPERLKHLLAENFTEIGSSGRVWTKRTTIESIKNKSFIQTRIKNFKLNLLLENVALVTYYAHREKAGKNSYRSSIWIFCDNEWKIFFHQGTLNK